jgi:CPA1 family monovalent cation:H+ antiporter
MSIFDLFGALTALAGLFAWVNHRWLRLPMVIGLMAMSLVLSVVLLLLAALGTGVEQPLVDAVSQVDFNETLLHGMLGALLFAGALHVNLDELLERSDAVAALAVISTLLSTLLVAGLTRIVLGAIGIELAWIWALVFGALISPTDPVAVLSILKQVDVPRSLEVKIAGESLFNDGIGVVVFVALAGLASGAQEPGLGHLIELFALEVGGGVLLGLGLGWLAYRMLHSVDAYAVEILVTLALVTGGYALAQYLHTSGPLAMVVSGLLLGNRGRRLAMSERTRLRLDEFWELVDEFLNAILFVLIGLELIVIRFDVPLLAAGALAIPLVLLCRLISVSTSVFLLRLRREISPNAVTLLTWGGLRGGISVALALSLPPGETRATIVAITYAVVAFSILVQGLSMKPLLRRLYPAG